MTLSKHFSNKRFVINSLVILLIINSVVAPARAMQMALLAAAGPSEIQQAHFTSTSSLNHHSQHLSASTPADCHGADIGANTKQLADEFSACCAVQCEMCHWFKISLDMTPALASPIALHFFDNSSVYFSPLPAHLSALLRPPTR
jgi:hypothetical protein